MATAPTVSFMQPTDPGSYVAQFQLQRQQAIADALLQQSQQPLSADLPQNLRVVPRMGVAGGMLKLAQALMANKLETNVTDKRAALAQQQMAQMAGMFGGGAQTAPPQAAPFQQAQAAMAQPGQGMALGPTNAAAAMVPPPAPQQAPAAPPAAPMQIPGMDPQAAMRYWMSDPGGYMKQLAESRMPTNEQKNWNAQGVDPRALGAGVTMAGQRQGMTDLERLQDARSRVPSGTPQAAQLDDAISKANYIAPIDARAGTSVLDPYSLQPRFFAPSSARGIGMSFGSDPLHPTAFALPGYAAANAGIASAEQGARTDQQISTVPGPNGAQISGRNGQLFPNGQAAGVPPITPAQQASNGSERLSILRTERAKPDNSADDNAALDREIQRAGGGRQVGTISGQSTTDAEINKGAAEAITSAPQQVQTSKAAITGLESALNILQKVRATGPGTAKTTEILAAIRNAGVPIPDDGVNSYQTMTKFLQNSLNAAANSSSAGGSDARFESFMHGQPNADTMNKAALENALRYVISQHDAARARGEFLPKAYNTAKAAGDPNPALTAQQQWAQIYNPQMFVFSRMAPAERVAFKASLSPQQQQQFGQAYNTMHEHGWVQ